MIHALMEVTFKKKKNERGHMLSNYHQVSEKAEVGEEFSILLRRNGLISRMCRELLRQSTP